jgi:hypothetical protein
MNFKASMNDRVELLVDVLSDFGDRVIPKGTCGTVVERYEQPKEGYSIDVEIADDTLVGEIRYENVVLLPEQFMVRKQIVAQRDVNVRKRD